MNNQYKTILIHSNPINPDSRLEKEASSLANNGYDVSILGWGRWGDAPLYEKKKNYEIYRFGLHAPVAFNVIFFWPIWWIYILIWLIGHKWDVVHSADIDCYFPSLIAAKIKRKHIIYDIFDSAADNIRINENIRRLIKFIDTSLLKFADKVIIVDSCRINQILYHDCENIPENLYIIYNTPEDYPKMSELHNNMRSEEFNVFYAGTLTPDRDIFSMINLTNEIDNMHVYIAGFGDHPSITKRLIDLDLKLNQITYLGCIPYEKVLNYSSSSDLLFALYDPSIPNNVLASPNKLFEAMMCSKPIIVNEGVATADKVRDEKCGLVVPYGDNDALKEAVLYLKNNPDIRSELGRNGRQAYEMKYNWKIMEKQLLTLYASLFENHNSVKINGEKS